MTLLFLLAKKKMEKGQKDRTVGGSERDGTARTDQSLKNKRSKVGRKIM